MQPSQPPFKKHTPAPPFRPTVRGCVGQDLSLARVAEEFYPELLASSVAYTYRSLLAEEEDPLLADRLDRFSAEDAEHFRMLGRLILALGGDPAHRTHLTLGGERASGPAPTSALLKSALAEEKHLIDRLETLMGKSRDRVVRSLLSYVLEDHSRRLRFLEKEYADRTQK